MGEYEPHDSRIVTNNPSNTPIEPERTGPQESQTRGAGDRNAPSQEQPAEGEREETEQDRWQVDEDLQRERDNPGSSDHEGAGDAGRDPGEAVKEKQPIPRDSLGARHVEPRPESEDQ